MARYLTEGIGTFFLVLITTIAFSIGGTMGPFAIGAGITALVYMGYHISGAHYNPAVSLAAFINGKLSLLDLGIFAGIQFVAGFAATALHNLLVRVVDEDAMFKLVIEPKSPAFILEGTLVEILVSFILVLVILNVSMHAGTKGNSFYGLAYGMTVFVGVLLFRELSGSSFNPALTLAPNVIHYTYAASPEVWLIAGVAGPLVGGALAGFVFQVQAGLAPNPSDRQAMLARERASAADPQKEEILKTEASTDQVDQKEKDKA